MTESPTCKRHVAYWLPRLKIYVCSHHAPAGEESRQVREPEYVCEWDLQGTDATQARRFELRVEALKAASAT